MLLKKDEEEIRIAVENNEYVANSYIKQLLGELDRLRIYEKSMKEIENLSKYAWEQVDKNPLEAKSVFKLIYGKSSLLSCYGKQTVLSNFT
jgi:hypothetical protein